MSNLLETRDLCKFFKTRRGMLHAVDKVNFSIEAGTTLGVVGESGCGKSTLGRTLIHLHEPTSGQIIFEGRDITRLNRKETFAMRSNAQMIFQDPYASLNGRMTVNEIIAEPLVISGMKRRDIYNEVTELMDLVGLDQRFINAYPHEMDGGRRQRIGIARALALRPKFVVCDEPVSALDVSVQAQILNLMQDLQQSRGLTYMFITHDLAVVKYLAEKIMVMYLGQVVEMCDADELFAQTLHPYSQALLSAIPVPDIRYKQERILLTGEISSPVEPKPGCRFKPRCRYACDRCDAAQELREVRPGHFIACCRAEEIN